MLGTPFRCCGMVSALFSVAGIAELDRVALVPLRVLGAPFANMLDALIFVMRFWYAHGSVGMFQLVSTASR